MDYLRLSKIISLALRHTPEKYNMILDNQGWGCVSMLVENIANLHIEYAEISMQDLVSAINISVKKRHELKGEKIRALYGHSIASSFKRENSIPPIYLYHGTSIRNVKKIKIEGLMKMKRQFVHLSSDIEQATQVAIRKTTNPIILKIKALQASNTGIIFYKVNNVWLCDFIAASFIEPQM